MSKKLIAVGVIGDWNGPWHRAQGSERSAVAGPIGEGEQVHLEIEAEDGTVIRLDLSVVPVRLLPVNWTRYRVVKRCAGAAAPIPTSVEVTLDGSPSTQAGHTYDSERANR